MCPSRRSFLKHVSLGSLSLWLPGISHAEKPITNIGGSGLLPRSTPATQGVSSQSILNFLKETEARKFELHSFMMLRHGQVIAEGWWAPYERDFIHTLYSMSKSFTSTAVGFAVAEGKLTVEDKVISFFPDELPETLSENLKALRVKDLLSMSVGNEKEPTQTVVKSENWVRTFLAQPIAHQPGTQFMYNSAATYMCSAIVQKVTGQKILDYLTPRLFTPLGITGMTWETCPLGINTGGWGLSVQTEALAKFGQLFLQKGVWQGKQILPAAWITEATSFHIQQPGDDKPDRPKAENDWLQGYGYQFWRCQHGNYRGDGAFGQFTIVLPEQDAVIVMTSENKNMQGQLDLVWKHLLPALKEKGQASETALTQKLQTLQLTPPKSSAATPNMERINQKKFSLASNDLGFTTLTLSFKDHACTLDLETAEGSQHLTCGFEKWSPVEAAIPGTPPRLISGGKPKTTPRSLIAAAAAWIEVDTLQLTLRYLKTPHHDTLTLKFEGDSVTLSFLNSITAMNPAAKDTRAPIQGTLKA